MEISSTGWAEPCVEVCEVQEATVDVGAGCLAEGADREACPRLLHSPCPRSLLRLLTPFSLQSPGRTAYACTSEQEAGGLCSGVACTNWLPHVSLQARTLTICIVYGRVYRCLWRGLCCTTAPHQNLLLALVFACAERGHARINLQTERGQLRLRTKVAFCEILPPGSGLLPMRGTL